MKCPRCGQFIIDKKQYCIHCGAEIYQEKGITFTPRMLMIVMGLMVSFGIILTTSIMFLNTDKEVSTFMKESQEKITVEQIYGDFIINKLIPGLHGSSSFDQSELGWNVSIYENQFKISSCSIGCFDMRDILIEETNDLKLDSLSWLNNYYKVFKIIDNTTTETYYVVKTKTSEYLYIKDTFIQLIKENSFSTNDNYHRFLAPSNTKSEPINGMIKTFEDEYRAAVESYAQSIIDYNYFETFYHINFLVLFSSINDTSYIRAIGYTDTFEVVSLKSYFELLGFDVKKEEGRINRSLLEKGLNQIDSATFTDYYVDRGIIYIIINGISYVF